MRTKLNFFEFMLNIDKICTSDTRASAVLDDIQCCIRIYWKVHNRFAVNDRSERNIISNPIQDVELFVQWKLGLCLRQTIITKFDYSCNKFDIIHFRRTQKHLNYYYGSCRVSLMLELTDTSSSEFFVLFTAHDIFCFTEMFLYHFSYHNLRHLRVLSPEKERIRVISSHYNA